MDKKDLLPRSVIIENFKKQNFISFTDDAILDTALTHRSFTNEGDQSAEIFNNERLEFLGDSVLGSVIALLLYSEMPKSPEGELARIKSIVVSESVLASIAVDIGLPNLIKLGKGEELSAGRMKKAILADALEAIIGAIFLDSGYVVASVFIERIFLSHIKKTIDGRSKDYKTIIQEYSQKSFQRLPSYKLEKMEGPDHAKIFWASCILGTKSYGPCSGVSKKEAEQAVAEMAFKEISRESAESASTLDEIASLSR
jgi:ribonuclease-3